MPPLASDAEGAAADALRDCSAMGYGVKTAMSDLAEAMPIVSCVSVVAVSRGRSGSLSL